MENLSIGEFKHMCDKLSPNEFIISTDNQTMDISELGMRCNFVFPTMIVHTNPNSIYFKDAHSYIKFDRIKHIIKREDSLLGKVFSIICTGFLNTNKETLYTIIVR